MTHRSGLFLRGPVAQKRPKEAEYRTALARLIETLVTPVPPHPKPFVLAVLGGPGSGKTHLTAQLEGRSQMARLDLDRATSFHPDLPFLLDDDPMLAPHRARAIALRFLIAAKTAAIASSRPILLEDCPQGGSWARSAFKPFVTAGWPIFVIPLPCNPAIAEARCRARLAAWPENGAAFPQTLHAEELQQAGPRLDKTVAQLREMPGCKIITAETWASELYPKLLGS